MKNIAISFLLCVFSFVSYSQDYIHLKDKSFIKCRIVEVTPDYVRYKNYPVKEDAAIFTIEKIKVLEIAMEDGTRIKVENTTQSGIDSRDYFFGQNTQAVKFDFLAPFNNTLSFKYEKSLKPGRSYEAWIGLPGLGFSTDETVNSRGIFIGGGFKFLNTPQYITPNVRRAHILGGYYVRPSVVFTAHRYEELIFLFDPQVGTISTKERTNVIGLGILVYGGRQWVFDNIFLIDINFGIGYGFTNGDKPSAYGFVTTGTGIPLALNGSLSIGYLFDTKRKSERRRP